MYTYDQLNRLKKARGVIGLTSTNTWDGVTDTGINEDNRYRSEYEYDANGNITSTDRYTNGGMQYDDMTYGYNTQNTTGRLLRNRLYQVTEVIGNSVVTDVGDYDQDLAPLIDGHNMANTINTANKYGYDALGNLVRDNDAQISLIEWTVAGKVKSVSRTTGSTREPLSFGYGASGQRIMKQVGADPIAGSGYREHYIRDAQGNIMATYRYINTGPASLKLGDRPVYGSSRLGTYGQEVELHSLQNWDPADPVLMDEVALHYELTDHLGNVCAVVTGRLMDGNGGGTLKQAELVSAQGYEPFGSLLPGRNYSSDSYRFSFNGKENDDEVHNATGTSVDFGARLYDPRVSRWLSLDPLADLYPEFSPYSFTLNNPLQYRDVDGRGINGGFSVVNQSTQPIVIVGNSHTVIESGSLFKNDVEQPNDNGVTLTLQPGQRFEAHVIRTKNDDGTTTVKYTGRVVQFATLEGGKLVDLPSPVLVESSAANPNPNDVGIWDVDYIEVQDGQMFQDRHGHIWSTDTNDKGATTPNPGTGPGTIKLQSPVGPAIAGYLGMDPSESTANKGSAIIRNGVGQPTGKLRIETAGNFEGLAPEVQFGEGIPH